jgi:hypothetical protein
LTLYVTPVFYIYGAAAGASRKFEDRACGGNEIKPSASSWSMSIARRRSRTCRPGLRHRSPARKGLDALLKGTLISSIIGYRPGWSSFPPDLIEIGRCPFPIQGYKPTREEAVENYRGVSAQRSSRSIFASASATSANAGDFTVVTDKQEYQT